MDANDNFLQRTKDDTIFMTKYGLKQIEFACRDDACFKASFVDEQGNTFEFKMSKEKVLEHIKRHCAHYYKYVENKGLVVAHFERMAKNWYAFTHDEK